jgi:hypothetical protein
MANTIGCMLWILFQNDARKVVGASKMFFLVEPGALAIVNAFQAIVLELCNLLMHTKKMELKCQLMKIKCNYCWKGWKINTMNEEFELGIFASILGWSPTLFINSTHLSLMIHNVHMGVFQCEDDSLKGHQSYECNFHEFYYRPWSCIWTIENV